MGQNSPNNPLINILLEDLNPLIISYGFECDNNKTDISDQRIKLYYEYQSLRLKDKVCVEMVSVPLMSFTMHCTAYIPLLGDSTSVAFNWMRETRESVISRFEKQFITQLVQLLSHGINDLPEELCLKIIAYLPYNSIIQLSQTNKFWRYICDNDTVWHSIYRHKYTAVSYNNAKTVDRHVEESLQRRVHPTQDYSKTKE